MEIYKNTLGEECVIVTNENGTTWSGLKSAYDEMQVEHLTEIPTEEAYKATLASELSNPSTPQAGE